MTFSLNYIAKECIETIGRGNALERQALNTMAQPPPVLTGKVGNELDDPHRGLPAHRP